MTFLERTTAVPLWVWAVGVIAVGLELAYPSFWRYQHHHVERPAIIASAKERGAQVIGPGSLAVASAHTPSDYDLVIIEERSGRREETYYDARGNMTIVSYDNGRWVGTYSSKHADNLLSSFFIIGMIVSGISVVPAIARTGSWFGGVGLYRAMKPTEWGFFLIGTALCLISFVGGSYAT